MRNDRGYTYLITNGREYKIGITTKTPVSRVAELQTGSPTKISISGYSYNSNALAMEIELHNMFAGKRLEGEWFALNDVDVAIIHHHFETNHLDEYLAPLSARGVEEKRKEKEREAERKRQQELEALRREVAKKKRKDKYIKDAPKREAAKKKREAAKKKHEAKKKIKMKELRNKVEAKLKAGCDSEKKKLEAEEEKKIPERHNELKKYENESNQLTFKSKLINYFNKLYKK